MEPNKFSLAIGFEKLCEQLLSKYAEYVEFVNQGRDVGYDLIAYKGGKSCFVEVKLYRSFSIAPDTIRGAAAILSSATSVNEGTQRLLMVNAEVKPRLKQEVFELFGVRIWDIKTLFYLALEYPDLYHTLGSLSVQATNRAADRYGIVDVSEHIDYISQLFVPAAPTNVPPNLKTHKGEDLCNDLKKIESGNERDDDSDSPTARQYEHKCTEILKYLFDTDLGVWDEQKHTDGNMHIFDLICRISSQHNFWQDLAKDFKTRYVIFEFKNYENKIKQGQIYTTEKYLFTTALRSVAFIISRKGPDTNAQNAAKGALREQGKLIINLTDEDLCEMLKLKDKSGEHNEVLIRKVDDLLIKLTR